MSYYSGGFGEYVSVGERVKRAKAEAAKLAKKGRKLAPVTIEGRKIATTFWGKAWCTHLESYSDYASRLPRGRSYVTNGLVIDLQLTKGKIEALVYGSELYHVSISVVQLPAARWETLRKACSGRIESLIELLQGRLADDVMRHVCDRATGLFPGPREIRLGCDCPDAAGMCKHIAAVLYGVGARLDREPSLLFVLRGVNHEELVDTAGAAPPTAGSAPHGLEGEDLGALFGIDLAPLEEKKKGRSERARSPRPRKT